MASVQNLFRAPKKRLPMEELTEVRAVGDSGFEGCAHARPGRSRQVLLVDSETLEAMDLQPGMLRENITTNGLNVNSLAIGQQLRSVKRGWKSARSARLATRWRRSGRDCEKSSGDGAECCAE